MFRTIYRGVFVIHIVHVETGRHLYGGARQVLLLMRGLAARGHRSTLVCAGDSDIAISARRAGIDVRSIATRGDLDVGLTWRLARMLRAIGPDVVHVHSRRGADTFGGLAARLASVPAVLSRRVDSADPPLIGQLKYVAYRRIVAISSCIRDQLAAFGVPDSKLRLVRSAVDAAVYGDAASGQAFANEFEMPPGAFSIAVIAQLIARKGHRFFFEALARLCPAHPEIRAVLFGVGPLQPELVGLVASHKLESNVSFVGYHHDLDRFIGHFDLVVHAAEREGLGVGVLEAQAAGVPVVAFRAGGLVEAVAEGETGLLAPVGDVAALADAIRRLVEDDELRRRLAGAGPAYIATRFGADPMVDGNLAVYRELLDETAV